jgi:hypothetical protein
MVSDLPRSLPGGLEASFRFGDWRHSALGEQRGHDCGVRVSMDRPWLFGLNRDLFSWLAVYPILLAMSSAPHVRS